MHNSLEPQIYICGIGVRAPHHFTIETLDALDKCTTIFSILKSAEKNVLPQSLQERFCSLWHLYKPGALRHKAYAAQIATVLEEAAKQPPVAYLTQGNPIFFDSVTQGLLEEGNKREIRVKVLAAVSSIDTILVDLQRDVAPGIQIYDASAVLLHKIDLRTDIPCLLLQPHIFGTLYVAGDHQPKADMFKPLRDYLLQFYDSDHEIISVTSATSRMITPILHRFQLVNLGNPERTEHTMGASLFIPASKQLEVDQEFLQTMLDSKRLAEVYGFSNTDNER